ncbi:MAG: hypothetical protein H0T19_07520 [Thermoleophilaceae bacterium]|nr:hypothetical protein [Thermoleophilaceae bacterium]
MQGFMRRRGKSWELRVYLGRDAVSGKKRWATHTVRAGKGDARRALTAMAMANDLAVYTCNPADFEGIEGLEVI